MVSGLTVMTALAGLFLTGYSLFTGMAIGAIIVVGIAVTGSLTVLPAMLSWLGDRVDKGRIPFIGRRRAAAAPSTAWAALVRRVVRRPLAVGRRGHDRDAGHRRARAGHPPRLPGDRRPGGPARGVHHRGDPGGLPAEPRARRGGRHRPAPHRPRRHQRDHLTGQACRQRGGPIREPVTATAVADGRALVVSVPLAGNGGDAASYNALDTLRDRILPETLGQAGVSYAVAGDTADSHDDASQLSARTPLVLAVVAAVAFCLLLLAFRSVVLPLVSIALNFLSVAAAYGLITFIFQDGRLQGLLGYPAPARSPRGCRCSCSRSCSASRWTTTSSS